MVSRGRYSPTRVSQALLSRLERHKAFQHMTLNQPSYAKDVLSLTTHMQAWQVHPPIKDLQVLMGPAFVADSIDRAALIVWAAMRVAMEGDRCAAGPTLVSLVELPPLFEPVRRALQTITLGSTPIPVIRPSGAVGHWEAGGLLVEDGVLSMTVSTPQEQATEFEGVSAWLMFKRSDGSEIPLAQGTVNGGKISFTMDLRAQGLVAERAILKDPTVIQRRFAVRLV